ncbi:1-acyl-sn-glycerol-3-phosphate acyltransferases [Jatrophihabitans endophyticus]|uniref:1-acyl-sn-glycerol-3-phosphate acyltransferases n=1 Tax=Jatrophihabitans endophyticus TaxID=1206085 RepID=A0A1M5R979_9ACTN|nr:lysophospholipid acyltransferase family protein [Jatrophihabitans endophyticus]SHH22904.1 1-acyl-sn-glycerol-3-phosphate acyltransferases [Jatrophihabitans endophyticus]
MSRLHKPKAGFWIRLCVVILYPLDGLLFRVRWRHLDRMPAPKDSGVLIAMNHISIVDTVLMARLVWQSGRIPRFMIKSGVFDWPVVGRIMSGAGQIPVHRGTTDAAQSLRHAVAALERHEAIVIYPEGTTTKDPANWPMQGKTGIARLVLLAPDVPVVPVGQWGAEKRGGRGPARLGLSLGRRRTAQASVGEPLDLSHWRGVEPTQENLRAITDEIMAAVRQQVAVLRNEPAPPTFYVPTRTYVDRKRKSA